MRNTAFLLSFIFGYFITFYPIEARANACLVASEEGGSEYCDDGSPQTGLPVHSATTTSKAGTTGLCNNVNVFADEKQAREYAKTHEYDSIEKQNGASCWVPKCTYTSDCSGNGKTCCKSLINNTCWHECDICKFNRIGDNYYPYADKSMESCNLIGKGKMNSAHSPYTDARSYKIDGFIDLVPNNGWNTAIWKCDAASLASHLNNCKKSVPLVNGFKSTSSATKMCINGKDFEFSADAETFLEQYGCPKSAILCDNNKGYYNSQADCEQKNTHQSKDCHVIKSYNGYADDECWHQAMNCIDFSHGGYHTGVWETMTCENYPNTHREYYCPKGTTNCIASSAVELNNRKCGACECNTGFSRADDCNSLLYDIIVGYYDAANSCQAMGYNKTSGINNNCEACPYNARYWRCN